MFYKVFTTRFCPHCPPVKEYLASKKEWEGKMIDVSTSAGFEEAQKYGINGVPTVIFFEGKKELGRFHSAEEIENFVKSNKK